MKEKYTVEYWAKEIGRTKEKNQRFFDDAKESQSVYDGLKKWDDVERRINVWKYIVQTLVPAYYSRPPKAECELRKYKGTGLAQFSALMVESFTQTGLDEFMDFDKLALESAMSFLLVGRSVLWVRYSSDIEETAQKFPLRHNAESGLYTYEDGKEYEGQDIIEEEGGQIFSFEKVQEKVGEKAIIEHVHHTDYFQGCARTRDEIEWKSRRAFMAREKVEAKFGKDAADGLKYNAFPDHDDVKRSRNDSSEYEGKAEIYEIWCEESGKVYYAQLDGEKKFLESQSAPISYQGFYPCETLDMGCTPSSTIPVSDYSFARDQIMLAEQLTTRIFGTLRAIRSNGVYDPALGSIIEELFVGDLMLKPAKHWPQSSSGNISFDGLIGMLPVGPYVEALQVLIQAREQALQQLYEMTKASDILRGQSEPEQTATAVKLKADFSSLGLKSRQIQFAEFMSAGISKFGELLCQQFSPERLLDMAGAEDLLTRMPQGVTVEQVMQFIKTTPGKNFRIQIASDALMALDERGEKEERINLLKSAGGYMQELVPLVQEYPMIAPLGLELLKYAIKSYKSGKELEPIIATTYQAITQAAQQKQAAQAQQPPDPAQIKAQTDLQIAQMEMQTKQMQAQMELKKASTTAQIEALKTQIDMRANQQTTALEVERLKLEHSKHQIDSMVRLQELDLRAQEIGSSIQTTEAEAAIKAQAEGVKQMLAAEKLEVEKYKAQLDGYEKLLEERRLALDQQMREKELAVSQMPPINIQVDASKPQKRTGRITRDDLGNATLTIDGD